MYVVVKNEAQLYCVKLNFKSRFALNKIDYKPSHYGLTIHSGFFHEKR